MHLTLKKETTRPAQINSLRQQARFDGVWLVSFMQHDLGYIDLEQKTLQTIDNPFGARASPMS